MKVNIKMLPGRDMFKNIQLNDCRMGPEFRRAAERILEMLEEKEYWDYEKMVELDAILITAYWNRYDNLSSVIDRATGVPYFMGWMKKATPPDYITRARRWLIENKYLIIKQQVLDQAAQAAELIRSRIEGGKVK